MCAHIYHTLNSGPFDFGFVACFKIQCAGIEYYTVKIKEQQHHWSSFGCQISILNFYCKWEREREKKTDASRHCEMYYNRKQCGYF